MPLIGGDYIATWVARVLTVLYFAFFLLMPWYTRRDPERPEPARVVY
jgi:ubiquinol-cytochrome c reductase cytochrome b subunit